METGRTLFHRCLANRQGVSTIEFAFIAPLLMIILLGSVELSLMTSMDRKVSAAAAALGDLASRELEIDDCELGDMFAATGLIFQPKSSANARFRLTSIRNEAGALQVVWSEARAPTDSDGTPLLGAMDDAALTGSGLAPSLIPEGQSALYAESIWPHASLFSQFGLIEYDGLLKDTFLVRPRNASEVERDTLSTC